MQSFQQNPHTIFLALVALKLLISLISRLVACSVRIVIDRQTDRQTDRHIDTQDNYCNPHCACALRVNSLKQYQYGTISYLHNYNEYMTCYIYY